MFSIVHCEYILGFYFLDLNCFEGNEKSDLLSQTPTDAVSGSEWPMMAMLRAVRRRHLELSDVQY